MVVVYMHLPVPVASNHNSCFDFEIHNYSAVVPERLYSLVESVAACRVSVGKDWAKYRVQGLRGPPGMYNSVQSPEDVVHRQLWNHQTYLLTGGDVVGLYMVLYLV